MGTPAAYKADYQKMTIFLPGVLVGPPGTPEFSADVSVQAYANTGSTDPKNKGHVLGLQDGTKDRVLGFLAYHNASPTTQPFQLPAGFSKGMVNEVYSGKGSVEAVKNTLKLFVCYETDMKGIVSRRKWPSRQAASDAVKKHCSQYVGLDCLGFVVNFVNHSKAKSLDSGNTDMQYFTGSQKGSRMLRSDPLTLLEEDVLVWLWKGDLKQYVRHIAVIEQVLSHGTDLAEVKIVESHGGTGLNERILALGKSSLVGDYGPVFKVRRTIMFSEENDTYVYAVPKTAF
jgi:hypothetical protein